MIIRVTILAIFLLAYILLTIFQDRIKWPSMANKVILIILSIIVIPLAFIEVTGFKASQTIENLNSTIEALNKKVEYQKEQLISQDTILKDISSKILVALEDECLKDLEERKNVIIKLHDKNFQISKNDYVNLVDSIFKEVEQLKNRKEKLSTEQKKLSDESLIYFEVLTNYVLDKFDNVVVQLNAKDEVIDIEKTEIPKRYFYADNGETIIVRKVVLKNNRRIRFQIVNRKLDKGKLVSLPSIGIIANTQSPRFSITGPPIKELKIGPQPGRISRWRGQELKITYPLGEDPLMSDSFRNSIDQNISEFIKLLYF